MNTSIAYLIGFLIVIGGLAYGATLAGVPATWIGVGVIVLVGIGIMSTVTKTRAPEPTNGEAHRKAATTTVRED
ncbi:hypothetical protein B5C34_03300 [Pacificimonas flava]|uniref:Uncharacterized protein n=2 Tax=Pacificimonas TaxID=1960290 RepID=A0A219B2J6_9SPHN|nr:MULTISPECIES: hypothetical protein [Pacificimonas]MBZ6377755.1 hypothetical protein [Pacificimonas aurantium]OWV32570.1 hypothetical protein B5C34_03300 [Pacificimonas flava]